MKYIIIKCKIGDTEWLRPFIFPKEMVHADMYQYMENMLRRKHNVDECSLHTAGALEDIDVTCVRGSETLKVKQADDISSEDIVLINTYAYTHGVI